MQMFLNCPELKNKIRCVIYELVQDLCPKVIKKNYVKGLLILFFMFNVNVSTLY